MIIMIDTMTNLITLLLIKTSSRSRIDSIKFKKREVKECIRVITAVDPSKLG